MATRPARGRSEEMTLQQLMGMVHGLQDAVAASKVEHERMQAEMAGQRRTGGYIPTQGIHNTIFTGNLGNSQYVHGTQSDLHGNGGS